MSDDDKWSDESGRKADPRRIVNKILSYHNEAGYPVDDGSIPDHNLNWDDPDDRQHVRRQFFENQTEDQFKRQHESMLPGFGPTGHGENAYDDCGNPHKFVCTDCGGTADIGRTCAKMDCARCGVAWVRDLAITKSAKIRRIRKEKHQATPDREHQKIHHQVINPDLSWYAALANAGYTFEKARDETKKIVKKILDEMRGQGLLIRHSYRGKKENGSIREEEDDRGLWKQLLNSDREWFGDVRDQLAWRPHYHCIVVSDWLQREGFTDVLHEKTGWVTARIEREVQKDRYNGMFADDAKVSIPDDGAMARAVTYCLSHGDVIVNDEKNNQSSNWEVGSFDGDIIRSNGTFSPQPHDVQWADGKVRDECPNLLGLSSGSSDCGKDLPAVDDPDELARRVLLELYPDAADQREQIDTDTVQYHLQEGNISVEVSTTSGSGGSITVRDAWGMRVGSDGFGKPAGDIPTPNSGAVAGDGGTISVDPIEDLDDERHGDESDDDQEGHDHGDDCSCGDGGGECEGQLIPLGEARARGFIHDENWQREAPFADEAIEADREEPDDLKRWRAKHPANALGA